MCRNCLTFRGPLSVKWDTLKISKRRKVAEVRGKIAYLLNREMGISIAEIGRNLGVGTSAIAMAIRKKEENG